MSIKMSGKISIVIITKNEQENIKECLESIKWADEIIIIDDFSNDRTGEICKGYGARVIVHKSNGNFDKQRNIGIENAIGDWIMQMDADEIIPEDTAKKIREAVNNPKNFVAFELKRKIFLFGYPLRYGGAYNYGIKLFKKEKGDYVGKVHETLKVNGKVGKINAEVYHYPFPSISEIVNKTNFYTEIESKLFVEKRDKISFREVKYRLTWKSLKLFWKLYVKKKGYRDGMYGLIWSILNVIGPQIRWLKIWEKAVEKKKLSK